ncbi:hypothetical protein VOLCADRAFT_98734 [Volvox carteri f. nagariensis]|uniref:Uncharacterized protein n=1 Tax=Volvox carteri f. nagariensis TaxID=3068 RepID=D8UG55_VOLCA|nr:uncharacterized protein VOLCADRAFT_98734 [Volvox carteri f. nagariensis]EFJ41316.1 hypothetical protein VOLCADRAFT_98734 [Volvox carteri f. nagariensis]|eukprot:XP_002957650.1 hypothetical protein VOLCADRAFT_98734 [Volvox carteri f. nagariensis]
MTASRSPSDPEGWYALHDRAYQLSSTTGATPPRQGIPASVAYCQRRSRVSGSMALIPSPPRLSGCPGLSTHLRPRDETDTSSLVVVAFALPVPLRLLAVARQTRALPITETALEPAGWEGTGY